MIVECDFKLIKIISGGQTGADQAGLYAARSFGVATGGWAPEGFKTIFGPAPELESFGLIAHSNYASRTSLNVRDSDGTVRLASNFQTPGEVCTLRSINKFRKPSLDITLFENDEFIETAAKEIVEFITTYSIQTLNIAGNTDRAIRFGFHFIKTQEVLSRALQLLLEDNKLLVEK